MQKGGESKLAATADALKKLESVSDFKYHKLSDKEVLSKLESNVEKGLTEM
jgi:Ca2+-transporting ATPase